MKGSKVFSLAALPLPTSSSAQVASVQRKASAFLLKRLQASVVKPPTRALCCSVKDNFVPNSNAAFPS